jgi:hypothetical protein
MEESKREKICTETNIDIFVHIVGHFACAVCPAATDARISF